MSTIDNVADVFDLQTTHVAVSQETIVNEFVKITQFATWPFLFVAFNLFFKIKIRGQEIFRDGKLKGPFMIVANHTAFYDSFLFRLILGLFTPHLPLRFIAVTKFENKFLNFLKSIGVIDFIYSLFGVLTVTPGLGIEKNIKASKEIIRSGGNIVIYPEGRIVKGGKIDNFKNGAAVLCRETGVKMIPVSFRQIPRTWFRRTIFIEIGKEISISDYRSIDDLTKILFKVVTKLHARR